MHGYRVALIALLAGCAQCGAPGKGRVDAGLAVPVIDHHEHLPSPAASALLGDDAPRVEPIAAARLVAEMDAAGVSRAVVLSVAYWFDSSRFEPLEDRYAKVRAENDWVASQTSRFPHRLISFCSFNPLAEHALAELERCARRLRMRGLKLHFTNSQVNVLEAGHVARVRRVFREANERRLPIVVHVRGDSRVYGRDHARAFLDEILPAAPDVTVQIAHLWGGETFSDSALAAYAGAFSADGTGPKNLYFDVADIVRWVNRSPADRRRVAERIRQIGPQRILWGSDMSPPNVPPREAWAAFRATVPLTDDEIATVAGNQAPYVR